LNQQFLLIPNSSKTLRDSDKRTRMPHIDVTSAKTSIEQPQTKYGITHSNMKTQLTKIPLNDTTICTEDNNKCAEQRT